MNKTEILNRLDQALMEFQRLRSMSPYSSAFYQWEERTSTSLRDIFGDESLTVKQFQAVKHLPMIPFGSEKDSAPFYIPALDKAERLLLTSKGDVERRGVPAVSSGSRQAFEVTKLTPSQLVSGLSIGSWILVVSAFIGTYSLGYASASYTSRPTSKVGNPISSDSQACGTAQGGQRFGAGS